MMKIVLILSSLLILCSCKKDVKNKDHLCNTDANQLNIISKSNNFHYKYGEQVTDSIIVYDKKCNIKEKCIYRNNLKIQNFDFSKYLNKEYITILVDKDYKRRSIVFSPKDSTVSEIFEVNSKNALNRYWKYKAKNVIDTTKSNFFEVNFPDTTSLKKRTFGSIDFNLLNDRDSLDIIEDISYQLIVVGQEINDNYSNIDEVKTDTFLTKENRFVTTFNRKGINRLKIKIVDRYYYRNEMEKAIVEMNKIYYVNRKVFVK